MTNSKCHAKQQPRYHIVTVASALRRVSEARQRNQLPSNKQEAQEQEGMLGCRQKKKKTQYLYSPFAIEKYLLATAANQ
jgi:hypothetical protein